jgi:predicted unusual protein kinase regulating ubiquinone biosynthesis (AarF/ABC1/UbiB family)
VQRPGARDEIMRDLGLLQLFAEKSEGREALRGFVDLPAVVAHLSDSLQRELDFEAEAANVGRLREVLAPFARLDVPNVYERLTTTRLLVLQEIEGGPVRDAPAGKARQEAAKQLLEAYFTQILVDGFFHADPHPGNLRWWQDKIWFLDLGMVGEVTPEIREHVLLLLLAFWQEDVPFLGEIVLALSEVGEGGVDMAALERDLGELMDRYRHTALGEIQIGPILQAVTETASRHGVRPPASLALAGKALAQMQMTAAELDPTLDPFSVVGGFFARDLLSRVRGSADPKRLFYDAQKLKIRATRFGEAVERIAGSRPGPRLAVDVPLIVPLQETIRAASRRMALGFSGGSALLATAVTAGDPDVADWVPLSLGAVGGLFSLLLLSDLFRRR